MPQFLPVNDGPVYNLKDKNRKNVAYVANQENKPSSAISDVIGLLIWILFNESVLLWKVL